ncbi:polyprenyl synthetase family protein [Campylobacter sp. RM16192]|uniref:polyprenyl synthetase family protein n=1 Tax=Campylobacter sp. RM16192 TaxID=1660080 RepID=UPI001451C0B4|nr:polyprenyl synthetase family protein [Campylobacter sp. RM16192]QCD51731.1 geranyl diphosphate synthase / farnesyl diphosphate synthase [Campylobacter sp. RM16192]
MNENLLNDFKSFLAENLPSAPSFHPYFDEALKYMLLAGGKHFRAMLLLGVVKALKPEVLKDAFDVALGFEMMHTYSLIHDDLPVMDNSQLRRGKPTLHVKFDEVTAVLVGDALNTHAFYQISKANLSPEIRIKCVEILSQNAGVSGMVLGQALDCHFENQRLGLQELTFLHLHKTAKLIAASLKAGCVIADMSYEDSEKIYKIGLDLGLAFQIADDIIDATKSATEAGKPTNNDGVKNSFTNLLGVKGAKEAKDELIEKIENELKSTHLGIKEIVANLIDRHLR